MSHHLPGYKRRKVAPGVTVYTDKRGDDGHYDTDQPWICWWFKSTDRETRITGRSRVLMECAVCGHSETLRIKIPRFGEVPVPKGGKHVERLRFMRAHLHPNKPHQIAWARPLLNPWPNGGIDLDLLAMRLEAEIRDAEEAA